MKKGNRGGQRGDKDGFDHGDLAGHTKDFSCFPERGRSHGRVVSRGVMVSLLELSRVPRLLKTECSLLGGGCRLQAESSEEEAVALGQVTHECAGCGSGEERKGEGGFGKYC